MSRVYCFASGHIGFGEKLPKGALPIATGPMTALRELMEATARRAYDGKTLLVPGVPEAADQGAALDAMADYVDWISTRLPEGVQTIHSKHRAARGIG